jgi:nucleoside-diphosphate-sugar epimerase
MRLAPGCGDSRRRPLNIRVLGSTRCRGRHLVDALLARGRALTLFTRGRTTCAPLAYDFAFARMSPFGLSANGVNRRRFLAR